MQKDGGSTDAAVGDITDDIEECSDGEAPRLPPPLPEHSAGAGGRYAALLGSRRSEGAPDEAPPGGVASAAETHVEPRMDASREAALPEAPVAVGLASGGGGLGLTQELSAVMDMATAPEAQPRNIVDEDTLPASSQALLDAALLHADGTMTGGGLPGGEEDDAIATTNPKAVDEAVPPPAASDDLGAGYLSEEDSDLDAADVQASGADGRRISTGSLGGLAEEELPDEPWMSLPARERELWERVRPRALRREAARLRDMRLPAAAVSRLLRLHPALQVRSSESLDIINYSTVLLLQAVARATARRKAPGQRISMEDLKQACSVRELQFLQPLGATLDATAHYVRGEGAANAAWAADDDGATVAAAGTAARRAPTGRRAPAVGPSQRVLDASAFVSRADGEVGNEAADPPVGAAAGAPSERECTPARQAVSKGDKKRRAPASVQKEAPAAASNVPRKAPRRGASSSAATGKAAAGPRIVDFFRRVESAVTSS